MDLHAKKARLSAKLYSDLSMNETSLWTACWIFGVVYSMFRFYKESQSFLDQHRSGLSNSEWEMFLENDVLSDSDWGQEWAMYLTNLYHSVPWLLLHFVGTQFLQRLSSRGLTIFQAALPLAFVYNELGSGPLLLILAQPFALFIVAEIFGKAIFVWAGALVVIVLHSEFEKLVFQGNNNHTLAEYNITHVIMFWTNSRCVSFLLDHIWKEVHEESKLWKLVQLFGYCFYLPILVQGPLINYKDYKNGVSKLSLIDY